MTTRKRSPLGYSLTANLTDPAVYQQVNRLAQRTDTSVSSIMRLALQRLLRQTRRNGSKWLIEQIHSERRNALSSQDNHAQEDSEEGGMETIA